jgi:hypothetical protein
MKRRTAAIESVHTYAQAQVSSIAAGESTFQLGLIYFQDFSTDYTDWEAPRFPQSLQTTFR